MSYPRVRAASVLSGLTLAVTALVVPGLVASSPAHAEPSIDDVQAKVDDLYHQAEQASERYNDAKLQLSKLRQDLGSLKADQRRQQKNVDTAQSDVRDAILRQYTGGTDGALGSVIKAGDPGSFLDRMSLLSSYQGIQQGLYDDYDTELKSLGIRRDATQRRRDEVAELKTQLADEKATVDNNLADAKDQLSQLKEKQREELASGGSVDPSTVDVPASGRAGAAIDYAMAQVGKAYVYGAAGPSAFDCSGLTMMAWAQAGVSLPHSSSAQYAMGPQVSMSDLQPGDLVFYYSPISHVAMYIGNGMIVHAANPSAGVEVSGVNTMPVAGAVRPG